VVVVDEVDVRFRAHEEVAHWIQPKASAEVSQEVCARRVVRTASESTIIEILIETNAFRADATHQFRADMLIEARRVDGIEVPKHGPVGLKSCIEILAGAPSYFALYTEILYDESVAAEVQIRTTTEALLEVGEAGGVIR